MPEEHALFAPSGAERWLSCPGSICLSKGLEEMPAEFAAEEGTAAHWLFEDFKNRSSYSRAPNGIEITVEMQMEIVESLKRVKQECPKIIDIWKETRLSVWEVLRLKKPVIWGTVDLVVFTKSDLYLIDFKYGKYKVPVKENKQLLTYAVGLLEHVQEYGQIHLVILQPRGSGDMWNPWTVQAAEIMNWANYLRTYFRARKSREYRKTFKPGKHCHFCLAKYNCSARMFVENM